MKAEGGRMKSVDFNTKIASEKIAEITTEEKILAFIEGDDRKTVADAALKKLNELNGPKQGEQTGPITKDADDFKKGIQKTKSFVTCEDVLEKMRAKGRDI